MYIISSKISTCFASMSSTKQALLINSANLMGGSSEPDGYRGFGRVHLEQGLPLSGEGNLTLFVADAANTFIPQLTLHEYMFDVDGEAGLDFRVTLSWIDPAATSLSTKQLVHDLDLAVSSPNGTRYTMWTSGETDDANVNERVIVDAVEVQNGTWTVWVWAKLLTVAEYQRYSLVVNGAIRSVTTNVADVDIPGSISSSDSGETSVDSSNSLSKSFVEQSWTAARASVLAVVGCTIVSALATVTLRT